MIVMVGNGALVRTFPVVGLFFWIGGDLPRLIARATERRAAFARRYHGLRSCQERVVRRRLPIISLKIRANLTARERADAD